MLRAMSGDSDFAEKAKEVEALAATTENPLLRMTLRILAHNYRALAGQEIDQQATLNILARDYRALAGQETDQGATLQPEGNGPRTHKTSM
jgi:hypothetical protein